jgi:hypothetical protein
LFFRGVKPWVSPGSEFDRRRAAYTPLEDLSPGYIHLTFHCTLAMYEKGRLSSATPCASGLVVLPTRLNEGQIQELAGLFQQAVTKSVRDSTWFSNGSVYHESTMALYKRARPLSKERKRVSNSNGPSACSEHDDPPGPHRQNAGALQADVVGLDGVLLERSNPIDDAS